MSSPFFNTSKQIASDFLQSIVFIDDKAFDNPLNKGEHDFDAYAVTNAFASYQKICAIYKPKNEQDISNLAQLAKKADVTVLDWQIDLHTEVPSKESEEEDDVNEDLRGIHTLRIIREILLDPVASKGGLKLILVYTGTPNLDDIAEAIHKNLESNGISLKRTFCEVCADNIKILVIAKTDQTLATEGGPQGQFAHNPDLKGRVVSYEQLPNYIIERFAKITTGLLPNFVLKALTVVRENTFKFVSLYNKDLDKAFLAHRLLLPDQNDSKELLVELFAHSIHSLLTYNSVAETVGTDNVLSWIDTQKLSAHLNIVCKNDKKKKVDIDNEFFKLWSKHGFVKAATELWQTHTYGTVDDKQEENFKVSLRKLKGHFLSDDINDPQDRQFSILTHHKSIFKPTPVSPRLTLGAVVRGKKSGYWVCIQQRCDSVRIYGVRRFLFLPLEELKPNSEGDFHFVTEQGVRLKLKKKSFELKTIKFLSNNKNGVIKAKKQNGKFFFTPYHYGANRRTQRNKNDELLEWIFDLKDLHAQRIAIEFANELSRVGIDEAEWLRRGYTR